MQFALAVILLCFLAFANGANDNFKGVATLFGSGTTNYKRALAWATFTTALGSLAALVLAKGLLVAFSGKGLVPASVLDLKSFPVSTTHVSCGSLFGIGATTGKAQWRTIAGILTSWVITLPVAAVLGGLFFWIFRNKPILGGSS